MEEGTTARYSFGFLSVQSSGLRYGSFPVEIGWAFPDGVSGSLPIKPFGGWDMSCWDRGAELMHGLSQAHLSDAGSDVCDAAAMLNEAFGPIPMFVDAPEHDRNWIDMIYQAANTDRIFRIVSVADLLARIGVDDAIAQQAFDNARAERIGHGKAADGALFLCKVCRLARTLQSRL